MKRNLILAVCVMLATGGILFAQSTTNVFGGGTISGSSSGTNTGDVTLGTANGLTLSGQQLSFGTAGANVTGAFTASTSAITTTESVGTNLTVFGDGGFLDNVSIVNTELLGGLLDAGAIFTTGTLGVTRLASLASGANVNGTVDAGVFFSSVSGTSFEQISANVGGINRIAIINTDNTNSSTVSELMLQAFGVNTGANQIRFDDPGVGALLFGQNTSTGSMQWAVATDPHLNLASKIMDLESDGRLFLYSSTTLIPVPAIRTVDGANTTVGIVEALGRDAGTANALSVVLPFSSALHVICMCNDEGASPAACGPTGAATASVVTFKSPLGGATDVIDWHCFGPK